MPAKCHAVPLSGQPDIYLIVKEKLHFFLEKKKNLLRPAAADDVEITFQGSIQNV